jgi:hypothetical protein
MIPDQYGRGFDASCLSILADQSVMRRRPTPALPSPAARAPHPPRDREQRRQHVEPVTLSELARLHHHSARALVTVAARRPCPGAPAWPDALASRRHPWVSGAKSMRAIMALIDAELGLFGRAIAGRILDFAARPQAPVYPTDDGSLGQSSGAPSLACDGALGVWAGRPSLTTSRQHSRPRG